jgi:hypothetical protein
VTVRIEPEPTQVASTPAEFERGLAELREIQRSGAIRLGGWHPTREELHERH